MNCLSRVNPEIFLACDIKRFLVNYSESVQRFYTDFMLQEFSVVKIFMKTSKELEGGNQTGKER